MIVLSKGYKKPQTGDFGSTFFPALEDNIELSNSHNHNGTNGEKVAGISLVGSSYTVLSAAFSDQGNGYYRATVTVPNSLLVDNFTVTIKDPTTKDPVYLKIAKLSSTQYYIYTNFVQDFEVFYGV